MAVEPLRTAMSIARIDDTSLAVPSDDKLRTGQQRVLDQVHTLKRSKSKQLKNGSLSPTSPKVYTTSSAESVVFKFSPATINGSVFGRSNSVNTSGYNKTLHQQKTRSFSTRSRKQVHSSSGGQWEQHFHTSNWPSPPKPQPQPQPPTLNNGIKPCASDPSLVVGNQLRRRAAGQTASTKQNKTTARHSMYSTGTEAVSNHVSTNQLLTTTTTNTTTVQNGTQPPRSPSGSHVDAKTSLVKTKTQVTVTNLLSNMPDLTMKEAVEYLLKEEEKYQLWGASFIQHSTFKEDKAKQEVLQLGGIPFLVALLRSSHSQVQETAAAALRNLVFKHDENKLEVQRCGGTDEALTLLKDTNSTFTQKQLTGLLWNLSSADSLKPGLIRTALPVLTESIVVPYSCWSDTSASNYGDPEVFHSATGCMRNLSCASREERQAMRDCPGLIDSIVNYVESCVAIDKADDTSVENCMCILHNLTYQLELEAPEQFSKYSEPETRDSANKKSQTIGCFSPKSKKIHENVFSSPLLDASAPQGLGLLYHSKTIQTYLTLLGSSQKDTTLEACCGALQNLTASKSPVSNLMSDTIGMKLGGLQQISPLLQSPNRGLQKAVMSLMGNLSRTSSLQTAMARQILPQVALLLSSGPKELGNCDDTLMMACNTTRTLLLAETDLCKRVVTTDLVNALTALSENSKFPKGSKAAAILLYSLWDEKEIQASLKKLGMNKTIFVNELTTAAHRSIQIIE